MTRTRGRNAWFASGTAAAIVAVVTVGSAAKDAHAKGRADPVVELGRRLFFDPAVSKSRDNSCAQCHDPEHGFASPRRVDADDFTLTKRHSQTLVDAANGRRFHWDGEFDSVEDLVTARLSDSKSRVGTHGRGLVKPDDGPPKPGGGGSYTPPTEPTPPPPSDPPTDSGMSDPPTSPPGDSKDSKDGKPDEKDGKSDSNDGKKYGSGADGSSADGDDGDYGPREVETKVVNGCVVTTVTKTVTKIPTNSKAGGAVDPGMRKPTDNAGDAKAEERAKKSENEKAAKEPTKVDKGDGDARNGPDPYVAPTTTPSDPQPATGDASATPEPESDGASSGSSSGSGWQPPTPTPNETPEGTTPTNGAVPTTGTKEGGKPTPEPKNASVAETLDKDGRYGEGFEAAFGSKRVSAARIAEAISAYVNSIRSTEAPFDRFLSGDATALSASAQRGHALFRGRAGCAQCHSLAGNRPQLTDHRFHNTGISARRLPAVVSPGTGPTPSLAEDPGLAGMSRAEPDLGSFKTPTLRDVALRPPYMHDGSFPTLASVVRNYARGSAKHSHLDPLIRPFAVSRADVADLVAFLESLSGDVRPGLAPDSERRAPRTTLRFVDAKGKPLAGVRAVLEPVGDRLPGDVPVASRVVEATSDERGQITFTPGRRTHTRVRLPEGVAAPLGAWLPDTCRSAEWTLAVEGEVSLLVHLPADAEAPSRLVAYREVRPLARADREVLASKAAAVFRANEERVATFALDGVTEVGGRPLARYRAWVPTDAPKTVVVDLPVDDRRILPDVEFRPGGEVRVDLAR